MEVKSEKFLDAAGEFFKAERTADLHKRKSLRIPNVVVPGSMYSLNMEDKDKNVVFRVVVY